MKNLILVKKVKFRGSLGWFHPENKVDVIVCKIGIKSSIGLTIEYISILDKLGQWNIEIKLPYPH